MARAAEETALSLTVRPSAAGLVPLIGALGYVEGRFAHGAELALPTGGAQLLVNLDGDAFSSSPLRGLAGVPGARPCRGRTRSRP